MAFLKTVLYGSVFGMTVAIFSILKETKVKRSQLQGSWMHVDKDPSTFKALLNIQRKIGMSPAFQELIGIFDQLIECIETEKKFSDLSATKNKFNKKLNELNLNSEQQLQLTEVFTNLSTYLVNKS